MRSATITIALLACGATVAGLPGAALAQGTPRATAYGADRQLGRAG